MKNHRYIILLLLWAGSVHAQIFPNRGYDALAEDSTTRYAECYLYDIPTALIPDDENFYLNYRLNLGSLGSKVAVGGFFAQRAQIELRLLFPDQDVGGDLAFKVQLWSAQSFKLATSFRFGSYNRELPVNKSNAYQDLLVHFSYIGIERLQLCGTAGVSLRSTYSGTTYYPLDLGAMYFVMPFVFVKASTRVYLFNPHDLDGHVAATAGVSFAHFFLELGYAKLGTPALESESGLIVSSGLTF